MKGTLVRMILVSILVIPASALADNDLEDLLELAQDPQIAAALEQVGQVPLSSNTVGYDPCDDPQSGADRRRGCFANGKIEHVIWMVMENHTFDDYLARVNMGKTRVAGSVDVATPERLVAQIEQPGGAPRSYRFAGDLFRLTEYCGWSDLGHSWSSVHRQVNKGKLDGFMVGSSTDSPVMGQFEYADLPYYYEIAERFAIADRFFPSAATQSWPNHYYTVSATSGGYIDNALPVLQDDPSRLLPQVDPENQTVSQPQTGHTWQTIFDSLEQSGVSWKIYMTNIAIPMAFSNFKTWTATGHVTTITEFYADVAAGTLPQVAYVAPGILYSDEHPGSGNHQRGMAQVATIANSLMLSPAWSSSVIYVTYDDSGGWYDGVPPPRAYQPDDRCDEDPKSTATNCVNGTWAPGAKAGYATALSTTAREGDNFDLLGSRIPFLIISPWVKKPEAGKGYVTHRIYENATVLSFIEWRFGVPSLNTRTRAYVEGWRNPGCDWDLAELADAVDDPGATEEVRALNWSARLFDPFRNVRCEPCAASDPFCPTFASPEAEAAHRDQDTDLRARVVTRDATGNIVRNASGNPVPGAPLELSIEENRYLDPLLDPFDLGQTAPGLLDGVGIVTSIPQAWMNEEQLVSCFPQ